MYYKIVNQESDIYKTLRAFRQNEIDIQKKNEKTIRERIPYDWTSFLGEYGQNNFNRVTTYSGFKFENPETVDLKVWKQDKNHSSCFVPKRTTKAGREMHEFLNKLDSSSLFKLCSILGLDTGGRFSFPFLEICEDTLVLYMDKKWTPEDESIIEITSKEFEQIRDSVIEE